jgi:hypothetical protein
MNSNSNCCTAAEYGASVCASATTSPLQSLHMPTSTSLCINNDDPNNYNRNRITSQRFVFSDAHVANMHKYTACSMLSSISHSCPNTPQWEQKLLHRSNDVMSDCKNISISLLYQTQKFLIPSSGAESSLASSSQSSSLSTITSSNSSRRRMMSSTQKQKHSKKRRVRRNAICWNLLPTTYEVVEEMINEVDDIADELTTSSSSLSSSLHMDSSEEFVAETRCTTTESCHKENKMSNTMIMTMPTIPSVSMSSLPMKQQRQQQVLLSSSSSSSLSTMMSSLDGMSIAPSSLSPLYVNRRFRRSSIRKDMSPRQPKRKASLTLASEDDTLAVLAQQHYCQSQNYTTMNHQHCVVDTPARQPERKLSISILTEPFQCCSLHLDETIATATATAIAIATKQKAATSA